MQLDANRLYVFGHAFEGVSYIIQNTQLIHTGLQLERIAFSCTPRLSVQLQLYALPYIPIALVDLQLHGHQLIEFESQRDFIEGHVNYINLTPRKIFDLNPICLVAHFNCILAAAASCQLIIEAHEYFTDEGDIALGKKDEPDMTMLTSIEAIRKLPDKISTSLELIEYCEKLFDLIMSTKPETPQDIITYSNTARMLVSLKRKMPSNEITSVTWDKLKAIFAGGPFAGFFTEQNRLFILQQLGD